MRHFIFFTCYFMLLGFTKTMAQGPTLSGVVKSKKQPVDNIAVSLIRAGDSSLLKTVLTGNDGRFVFADVQKDQYTLVLSGVGFQNKSIPVLFDGTTVLEDVELNTKDKLLAAVTVSSKRSFIEMKADKMLVNVDASPTSAGNNALELLEKIPGVTVDKDGNISLKGKEGVNVYIDGRPSYMSGAELANLLRGMNASQLEQLEIMTNPPAKYDAAGNAGIINIKTKKLKLKGFNGTISSSFGQGVYAKTNLGSSFNYRNNKVNLFGSVNHSYRDEFQKYEVSRNLYDPNTGELQTRFSQRGHMPNNRNSFSGKLGLDYEFNARTSASAAVNLFNTKMKFENQSTNAISDKNGVLLTRNYGLTILTPHVSNYSGALNLRHKFDTLGTELSFDADYIQYKDKHRQQFFNSFYDHNGVPLSKPDTLKGNLPTGYDIYAGRVDFTKPFSSSSKVEAGIKFSRVQSDNNIRFDSIVNDKPVNDIYRTNYFKYQENIYAAYATYKQALSAKWDMQAGLRYEHTIGKGHSLTNGAKFKNDYGELFPTLYLSYKASSKHQFAMNFGRRVNRPQYRDMNPFILIIDRYTSQSGNPGLQPQFSNNIELSHSYNSFLNTTLSYGKTTGVIAEVIENNSTTQEVKMIKRNIAERELLNLSVGFNKKLVSWLTLVVNSNVFHNQYKGSVNSTTVDQKRIGAGAYAALQFKFKKGWAAEMNGFYNTKSVDGISMDGAMGTINFAGSKTILKEKGKLTLNVRDPFRLQYYRGSTKFGDVDASIKSRWDNRQVTLAFNYRFGKQFKTIQRKSGSAAEEQGRIGGN